MSTSKGVGVVLGEDIQEGLESFRPEKKAILPNKFQMCKRQKRTFVAEEVLFTIKGGG